jgi:multisubunit Na+/H+ antiporter MnhB subunit
MDSSIVTVETSVTIAFMAKFRPFKGKRKSAPAPRGAVPCVVLVIGAMALVMFLLFLVMKNANG